jgi:hypothetical protein
MPHCGRGCEAAAESGSDQNRNENAKGAKGRKSAKGNQDRAQLSWPSFLLSVRLETPGLVDRLFVDMLYT